MLLLAIFLVFFFSSISELPRSLDLTLDRDPIFLRMAGREIGPVRPAKSRLGDHAKGGKALGPLFPSPCTDTRQSRKTCFSSFFSAISLRPRKSSPRKAGVTGKKSAIREGKRYRGLYRGSSHTLEFLDRSSIHLIVIESR